MSLEERAERVRHFNRLYTKEIGVLEEGLLHSAFSLTEARILFELANLPRPTANQLSKELGLDPGYVSRIVASFRKRGLLSRTSLHPIAASISCRSPRKENRNSPRSTNARTRRLAPDWHACRRPNRTIWFSPSTA